MHLNLLSLLKRTSTCTRGTNGLWLGFCTNEQQTYFLRQPEHLRWNCSFRRFQNFRSIQQNLGLLKRWKLWVCFHPHAHMNSCYLFEEGACAPGVPDVQSRSCAEQKMREPWRINACSNQTGANAAWQLKSNEGRSVWIAWWIMQTPVFCPIFRPEIHAVSWAWEALSSWTVADVNVLSCSMMWKQHQESCGNWSGGVSHIVVMELYIAKQWNV